ncbi:NAD(P)H-binding protein [Zunongwangia sp.]|uniref:NAD(P)H-binding protein n=1 Tax=Zunongwangia sp. TaxID=1965325 RepID=UPI003AA8DF07
MTKTAILLGATGLTGSFVLKELLVDKEYGKVILFSRSSCTIKDNKIEEHLIDLLKLDDFENLFKADHVFCCVGTTRKKTPNKETYFKIDCGIPVTAAKLSAKNGVKVYTVISAMGANANSSFLYNQIKGKMENGIKQQAIPKLYILRPSLITGNRGEVRFFEKLGQSIFSVLNPLLIGKLKKYRSISAEKIAKAMLYVANNSYSNIIIKSDEISSLAKKADD